MSVEPLKSRVENYATVVVCYFEQPPVSSCSDNDSDFSVDDSDDEMPPLLFLNQHIEDMCIPEGHAHVIYPSLSYIMCFLTIEYSYKNALQDAFPQLDVSSQKTVNEMPYLHYACHVHNRDAVRALIENGASLLARMAGGITPFLALCYESAFCGPSSCVWSMCQWLLANFADARSTVEIQDDEGYTPLCVAAANSNTGLVLELLKYGVSPVHTLRRMQEDPRETFSEKITLLLQTAERTLTRGEWRPCKHGHYPAGCCENVRTLALLAKTKCIYSLQ